VQILVVVAEAAEDAEEGPKLGFNIAPLPANLTPPYNGTGVSPERGAQIALCTIDGAMAVSRLGLFGTTIDSSTRDCKPAPGTKGAGLPALCATDVSLIVGNAAIAAAMLSDMAVACGPTNDSSAACSSMVNTVVGSTALVAAAAATVQKACDLPKEIKRSLAGETLPSPSNDSAMDGRRLGATAVKAGMLPSYLPGGNSSDGISPVRQNEVATCFFDALLTASFAAKMGLQINAAVKTCESNVTDVRERLCTVNIMGTVASFSLGASYLTQSVVACPVIKTQKYAPCAAKIMTLIGALSNVGSAASNYKLCEQEVARNATIENEEEDTPDAGR
jgi:hypothetical protein